MSLMRDLVTNHIENPLKYMRMILKLNRMLPKLKIYRVISPNTKYPKKLEEVKAILKRIKFNEGHEEW